MNLDTHVWNSLPGYTETVIFKTFVINLIFKNMYFIVKIIINRHDQIEFKFLWFSHETENFKYYFIYIIMFSQMC